MLPSRTHIVLLLLSIAVMLYSCGKPRKAAEIQPSVAETEMLLQYLEENGNLINSEAIPALISAADLHEQLVANNIHIIDLRPAADFESGHISHSVNVQPGDILDYFEQRIEPGSFDQIVLVCPNAQLSAFVNAVLLFLGYDNVHALRFGLSSWDQEIAERHWLAALSNHLEGQLETTGYPKNDPGVLPAIATGKTHGYQILRARAKEVLDTSFEDLGRTLQDITTAEDPVYLANYWPESLYNRGHLPGAIQYTPKVSLHSAEDIRTLPADRAVVMYCFTGQHSSYVTAFLRLLGYDAYSLAYGANSFIHNTMVTTQPPGRSFTEERIGHFPLAGKVPGAVAPKELQPTQKEAAPVIGGC
ncbi:MAG: rhodanese-like domain-containing protein [Bacteroidales bacterium]|nr:rhodanese-like domain-containing protein [Bacteroidales bacterium]